MCNAHTCIYPYIYGNHSAFFSALGALPQHRKQLALFYRFWVRQSSPIRRQNLVTQPPCRMTAVTLQTEHVPCPACRAS